MHSLLKPLSDIITNSCLAASKPGFMLLIFGFTPTSEPPKNNQKFSYKEFILGI